GKIDRLQAGADHLHGLVTGERAERVDEILLVDERPETVGSHFGQRVADIDTAAQPLDVVGAIGALDAVEATLRSAGNQFVKICHLFISLWICQAHMAKSSVTSFTDGNVRGPENMLKTLCKRG